MVVLIRGRVGINVSSGKVIDANGPTWFGEMAMLGLSEKRTATVRARTMCEARLLYREKFLEALEEVPNERRHFDDLAYSRVQALAEGRWGGTKIGGAREFNLRNISLFKDCDQKFLDYIHANLQTKAFLPDQSMIV